MSFSAFGIDEDKSLRVSRHAESKMVMKLSLLSEKYCSSLVQAYNACTKGRSMSMVFACRPQYRASQDCLHVYVNDDNLRTVKKRWIEAGRPRKPDWSELLAGMDHLPPTHIAEAVAKAAAQQQVAAQQQEQQASSQQ